MNSFFSPFKPSMRSYYFSFVVGGTQEAYRATGTLKSRAEIDLKFRDMFLYYEEVNADTGEYVKINHTLQLENTKVTDEMFLEFCLLCIMWVAVNLDWAIPLVVEDFCKKDMTDWQRKYLYNETLKAIAV